MTLCCWCLLSLLSCCRCRCIPGLSMLSLRLPAWCGLSFAQNSEARGSLVNLGATIIVAVGASRALDYGHSRAPCLVSYFSRRMHLLASLILVCMRVCVSQELRRQLDHHRRQEARDSPAAAREGPRQNDLELLRGESAPPVGPASEQQQPLAPPLASVHDHATRGGSNTAAAPLSATLDTAEPLPATGGKEGGVAAVVRGADRRAVQISVEEKPSALSGGVVPVSAGGGRTAGPGGNITGSVVGVAGSGSGVEPPALISVGAAAGAGVGARGWPSPPSPERGRPWSEGEAGVGTASSAELATVKEQVREQGAAGGRRVLVLKPLSMVYFLVGDLGGGGGLKWCRRTWPTEEMYMQYLVLRACCCSWVLELTAK